MDQNNGGIIGKINTPTTTLASGVWSLDSQFESQAGSTWPLAFPQTTIANSCRFNRASSDYLSQTISSSTGKTFTLSFWMKKSTDESSMGLFHLSSDNNGNHYIEIATKSGNGLDIQFKNGTSGTNGTFLRRRTNRLLRDFSAWMNVVIRFDSTQASASDRFRLYINGVQETSLDVDSTPDIPQDYVTDLNNNGSTLNIGRIVTGSNYYHGYFAEMILADGSSLGPTSFGATNPVTNIWEPITYTGTYGTNGFRLDFADSSALGNDVSGNNNDFTVNNLTSVDQSTDTCSNNFAVLNPIQFTGTTVPNHTFSNGNLSVSTTTTAGADSNVFGTFGVSQGKWYYEYKFTGGNTGMAAGYRGEDGDRMAYYSNGDKYDESGSSSYGDSYTTNDIIGVAADLDNGNLTFYKNGTSQGEITSAFTLANDQYYQPFLWDGSGSKYITCDVNFGNAPFSISSGNSDGNGYGNFEYSVPSGYYALNTKNLAEYG